MSTRGLIKIWDSTGDEPIVIIYVHTDASDLGQRIKKILNNGGVKILDMEGTNPKSFNGMGDLAAYLIMILKKESDNNILIGNNYSEFNIRFVYSLYPFDGTVHIRIFKDKDAVYDGSLVELKL